LYSAADLKSLIRQAAEFATEGSAMKLKNEEVQVTKSAVKRYRDTV